ncbi:DUF305 domain-containing protein [Streptomyces sp. MST-110588]|uniref:DUF305 domain-containing protein n=1 Tax=Streptomyces sp. MST-110588 TaxID=2833628 RepID=UPI001F5CAF17|nr:DUF305 domain-containing protein [Streptomyces sp. MST-110588]UNO44372.1 DUF305 domain-containing protein [Streptomyces sp. MST-110588]
MTLAALAVSACSAEGDGRADGGRAPKVIAPGKPGGPARTLSAEEAGEAVGDDSPNSADFGYVQMMIKHHEQALTMTGLAARYAGSPRVKRLAERIAAAQRPEIGAMRGWLKLHGGPRKTSGHHEHASMPGMATAAQLAALREARGQRFDELFLTLMTTHHTGAVTMATDVLSDGNNTLVEEMANDVIAQQTAEIGRMRSLRPAGPAAPKPSP